MRINSLRKPQSMLKKSDEAEVLNLQLLFGLFCSLSTSFRPLRTTLMIMFQVGLHVSGVCLGPSLSLVAQSPVNLLFNSMATHFRRVYIY